MVDPTELTTKDHIVNLQKFGYQFFISKEELEFAIKPQWVVEDAFRSMVAKITYKMYVENLEERIETRTKEHYHSYPKTWWDMFKDNYKDRWWMKWVVTRNPVQYQECKIKMTCKVKINPMLLFPDASKYIPVSKIGQPVRYMEVESESWLE